jgi:hypothetical protein
VQELEVLRQENAEMAALVAQLQVLKRDQGQLQALHDQVEALKADNSVLHRKSLRLPALHEEHERLQVGRLCACLISNMYCIELCHGPEWSQ